MCDSDHGLVNILHGRRCPARCKQVGFAHSCGVELSGCLVRPDKVLCVINRLRCAVGCFCPVRQVPIVERTRDVHAHHLLQEQQQDRPERCAVEVFAKTFSLQSWLHGLCMCMNDTSFTGLEFRIICVNVT